MHGTIMGWVKVQGVMSGYEYKVIPAPIRGKKAKGARSTADRFAHALAELMNAQARDGWDFQRAETLPCEEREGLLGKTTVYQNMLVFRRAVAPPDDASTTTETEVVQEPLALIAPQPVSSEPETPQQDADPAPVTLPGQTRDT